MFDLIRKTEGEISRDEFAKGILFVFALTVVAVGLFYFLGQVNKSMAWMIIAVAPILALVASFVGFSLLYFWTCLFLKRFRATGHSHWYIYIWLGLFFLAPVLQLAAYKIGGMSLPDGGFLNISNTLIWLARGLFIGLLILMLYFGLAKRGDA